MSFAARTLGNVVPAFSGIPDNYNVFGSGALYNSNTYAGWKMKSTGELARSQDTVAYNNYSNWYDGTPPITYHVRATVTGGSGGTLLGDATGSWLALTSDRHWQLYTGTVGYKNRNLTIDLSDDGGSSIIDTTSLQLEVDNPDIYP